MIQPRSPLPFPVMHHYRVDALRDHSVRVVTEYTGHDQAAAMQIIGKLCMEVVVDRIVVYRNGDEYRRIELR